MTSELNSYRTAKVLIDQRGDDALKHAESRAQELHDKGDLEGMGAWLRIVEAINILRSTKIEGVVH